MAWTSDVSRVMARVALSLLGLVAGLVLAELLARVALPQLKPPWAERSIFWRHDPLLGWSHQPGLRGAYSGPGFRVNVSINSLGLRDREHVLERPPGAPPRVLLLGDSFGWGYGVAQESTLAARLDRPDQGLEAVNGSVSGYNTVQQLLWYRQVGRRYHPDLVLVLVCGNDLTDNPGPSVYWYHKPYLELQGDSLLLRGVPVPKPTWAERVHMFLVGRTYLGSALRSAWWGMQRWRRADEPRPTAVAGSESVASPEDSSAYRLTAAVLRALEAETRADGAGLCLTLIPMAGDLAAWWTQTARAESIAVLDLAPAMRTSQVLHLPRDAHWNAAGNEVAARTVRPFLDSLLVKR